MTGCTVERAIAHADEATARRLVETMAVALQGSLLERHGDPAVSDAFRARRGFTGFGALPAGLQFTQIIERHRGAVAESLA
jgi:hypothetical protein